MQKWIQETGMKKGALKAELGIHNHVPKTLLEKIVKAKKGSVITNPTKIGRKRIKVVGVLKKRANLACNPGSHSRPRSGVCNAMGGPAGSPIFLALRA